MLKSQRNHRSIRMIPMGALYYRTKLLAKSRALYLSSLKRARLPVDTRYFRGLRGHRLAIQFPIVFPRNPVRPHEKEVDVKAVTSVEPDLSKFSLDSIQKGFGGTGLQLWGAARLLSAEPPLAVIPKEMELICSDFAASTCPSLMLAVYNQAPPIPIFSTRRIGYRPSYRRDISFIPVHSIALLSHCTHLPPIPKSQPNTTALRDIGDHKHIFSLRLPVIPLPLPVPNVFPVILQYMYTLNTRQFSYNLIRVPIPEGHTESRTMVMAHSVQIANRLDGKMMAMAQLTMWGVYKNMCVLGISDMKMWSILNINWEAWYGAQGMISQKAKMGNPDITWATEVNKVGELVPVPKVPDSGGGV